MRRGQPQNKRNRPLLLTPRRAMRIEYRNIRSLANRSTYAGSAVNDQEKYIQRETRFRIHLNVRTSSEANCTRTSRFQKCNGPRVLPFSCLIFSPATNNRPCCASAYVSQRGSLCRRFPFGRPSAIINTKGRWQVGEPVGR
jgi:hypothetical protein